MDRRPVPSPSAAEESLQKRFERAVAGQDLPLERARESDRCAVGVAVVPVAPAAPLIEVGQERDVYPAAADDEAAIRRLIEEWMTVHHDELIEKWGELATDPFIAVGSTWVDTLDRATIRRGLESPEFASEVAKYPPYKPRRVRISNLRIVFVGETKAAATFRGEEEYQNGQVFAGNSAMILIKGSDSRWRLIVFTKHNRFQDFLPMPAKAKKPRTKGKPKTSAPKPKRGSRTAAAKPAKAPASRAAAKRPAKAAPSRGRAKKTAATATRRKKR